MLDIAAQKSGFDFNEVAYTPSETTFRLFAPRTMKRVRLTVYDKDAPLPWENYLKKDSLGVYAALNEYRSYKMNHVGGDVWQAVVKGDLKGKYYSFNVADHTRVGMACVPIPFTYKTYFGETPGVFAKAVGVNGNRGAIIDLAETNPEGWENDRRPELKSPSDLVIYEMHHRDFSIDASSGIVHKGKFLALTEPKAIAHLRNLGVNAVHILPSYDFGSIDETRLDQPQYNWGYDPVNYNVPEGSYSTDPYDPLVRIREFKQMVQALHKAGIRVILDVVYNHTYDIAHSNFQRTYPDYFYRKTDRGDGPERVVGRAGLINYGPKENTGTYSDGSGCGNETASEQPMMRRFMIESVKYWATEYHIDGFRFDLMGVHDIETMNQIRAEADRIDPSIFIYGEGWSAGSCAHPAEELALKANISRMPRIAAFSDDIRDALRGPFSDDRKGAFLAGIAGEEESLKAGIAGMIAHPQIDYNKVNYSKKPWAAEPSQMVSYVSCHDDMCLVDRLRAEMPQITTEELIRLDLLAQTAVFTSQGVSFLLAGEEMLRDKKGVHNSYNSPDEINRLDWQNLTRYPQVFAYYKNLIRLRKNHPAFRMGDAEKVRRHLHFLPTEPCLVGFYIDGREVGDSWDRIVVILNSSKEPREVSVPEGSYTVVCCDGVIDEGGSEKTEGGKVVVDPQSALIIHS